jgi:hypothetical protein
MNIFFPHVSPHSIFMTIIEKKLILTPVLGPKRGIRAHEMGRCYQKRIRYVLGGVSPYEHFLFWMCHIL